MNNFIVHYRTLRWLVGVEVSVVLKTVGADKSPDKVIGAAIDRRIADDEESESCRACYGEREREREQLAGRNC